MPALIVAILFVFVLCLPIRCRVSVFWAGEKLCVEIRAMFLLGLIKIVRYSELDILTEIKKRRRKKRKIRPFELLHHIVEKGYIKYLEIHSRVGIKDDAFLTVLAVGFIRIFFEKLTEYLNLTKNTVSFINPCFSTNVFWIHLEGIVVIFPTQIIGIMVSKGR